MRANGSYVRYRAGFGGGVSGVSFSPVGTRDTRSIYQSMEGESWAWETKRSSGVSDWVWGYPRANVRDTGLNENI